MSKAVKSFGIILISLGIISLVLTIVNTTIHPIFTPLAGDMPDPYFDPDRGLGFIIKGEGIILIPVGVGFFLLGIKLGRSPSKRLTE